ncbi:MAG: chorismate mutase [Acidimicrobiia bacterium]
MATGEFGRPDLRDTRRKLDALDDQLVDVLRERLRLIEEVVRYKRAQGMAVVDRSREDEMLARVERVAAGKGLDPRIGRQVLRSVIDAFTLLEVERLGNSES